MSWDCQVFIYFLFLENKEQHVVLDVVSQIHNTGLSPRTVGLLFFLSALSFMALRSNLFLTYFTFWLLFLSFRLSRPANNDQALFFSSFILYIYIYNFFSLLGSLTVLLWFTPFWVQCRAAGFWDLHIAVENKPEADAGKDFALCSSRWSF